MPAVKKRKTNHLLMLVLFLGYMINVYVRESVTYAAPIIIKTEEMENSDFGLIVSSQKLGYTLIKVVGGTLVDVVDPGLVFTVSLLLSGLVAIGFAASSSIAMFSFVWFFSGMIQGPSWPAIGVLLKNSAEADQFATWWSLLSTSSNVAGTVGPLVSQMLNSLHPWRLTVTATGVVAMVTAVVLRMSLVYIQRQRRNESWSVEKEKKPKEVFAIGALMNVELLLVCVVYLLFGIVRGACNDWSQHYLIQAKAQTTRVGSWSISCQEVGGIVGCVVSGYLSDRNLQQSRHRALPRIQVQTLYSGLLAVSVFCLIFLVDPHTSQMWISAVSFGLGFSLYACISLVGIISMEVAPEHLGGTAHSLSTLAANVGRILAGYPLALLATHHGWDISFLTVLVVSLLSVVSSMVLGRLVKSKHAAQD